MFSKLFSARKRHSLVITRVISEMEQMQFTMTTDDTKDFNWMLKDAEGAAQWRADQFQQQVKAAGDAMAQETAEKEARVAETKKGKNNGR